MNLGVVMDPLVSIKAYKDSTVAMLRAAEKRDWRIHIMHPSALWLQDGLAWARMTVITVNDCDDDWYKVEGDMTQPLTELDIILMRKDPPFDMNYIYTTYLLEQAEAKGVAVINKPQSLRDANEKLFTTWFPQCCPPTLVSSQADLLVDFITNERQAIIKPLDSMAGQSVFRADARDSNVPVIIETLTHNGKQLVMAQRFIPEISAGDKRIILIDGQPIPYLLARVPQGRDFRGNLAAGAKGIAQELSEHDYWLCEQIGPTLREKGLVFVGIDVIGDYLTEINVTSPTGIREIDAAYPIAIGELLLDCLAEKMAHGAS